MKYRKKPVVIEARQFDNNNDVNEMNMNCLVGWICNEGGKARHDHTDIYIQTLEGEMKSQCGDYIIKGVAGEFYSCKKDIFEKTYEKVES